MEPLAAEQLRGDPGLPASKTEVIVCPGARLAFIHVYKASGTTIIASLHDLCQAMGSEARLICGHDGEKKWPVLQGDDQMWCDQTLAEAWDDIGNYSFFTFVRDPVERFGSGLFENAYRASQSNYSTCASQAGDSKEGIEGAIARTGAQACVTGGGSMYRVHFKPDAPLNYREAFQSPEEVARMKTMLDHLFDAGFMMINTCAFTLSTPMGEDEVDALVEAMEAGFRIIG